MSHTPDPDSIHRKRDGEALDPQLGGERRTAPDVFQGSGMEPLLGGRRRVGPDMTRIQALIDAPGEDERRRLLDHVMRLGQSRLYAEELMQVIPERARQKRGNWRGTFTPTQRVAALNALAIIGNGESVPVLLGVLGDSNYDVRRAAETALRAVVRRLDPTDSRTEAVFEKMIQALRLFSVRARKVIAHVLADAPADLVLGPLLWQGLASEEWWARRESAWVLGMLEDKRATRRLIALLDDPSGAVRASAAWALGRLDAPITLQPLAGAAADDDEVVRAAAVEALGAHAARLSPEDENYQSVLGALVNGLVDHDWSVRTAAMDALFELDTPEARLALQSFLNQRKGGAG